jgi:hypothetical protein
MSDSPMPPDDSGQPTGSRSTPGQTNPYETPHAQQMAPAAPGDMQGDATGGLIPYKNKCALIGYYLGVFSIFIPVVGGIASVVLGIMGLIAKKKNPAVRGTAHAIIAIVLGIVTAGFWLTCGGSLIFNIIR